MTDVLAPPPVLPTVSIPPTAPVAPGAGAIRVAPRLLESAAWIGTEVFARLGTTSSGLTAADASRRLAASGPNEVAVERPPSGFRRFLRLLRNPLVLLLTVLAAVSLATGDPRSAVVVAIMVVLGVALRFVQESRADAAAAALRAMIRVTATVTRDGAIMEVALADVVPGDVVTLAAGDMVPADVRFVATKDLFVNQASLTGESFPVEKHADPADVTTGTPLELTNIGFLGTSVQSGAATAAVVATGASTYLGGMAEHLAAPEAPTAFDRGVDRFTWLMIGFITVMVPLVFIINGVTKHDWHQAFFFALAVAVGLTPEMLPMIVAVSLSRGAVAMSRKRVIVKRLDAIQNVGGMDVLCTDKTGTLTQDVVMLERHCDVTGRESDAVLLAASLVSHFQTGLRNVLDRAILAAHETQPHLPLDPFTKIDEIPFDFERRLMSVVVAVPGGGHRLIAKGAPEEVLRRCTRFATGDDADAHVLGVSAVRDIDASCSAALQQEYDTLSAQGFRVLAVASRDVPARGADPTRTTYGVADEADLTLVGYVAFLDPPKESAAPALAALAASGIAVKVLTGDNELVTRTVCAHVGLAVDRVLLGRDVAAMEDAALGAAVEATTVFARLSPADKQRIITVLQARVHVVGFLGDGINDAPALRAADVGISVDTAVDVAKASADIILLEKSLLVLQEGVIEGRKVFSNVIKYVRMGASSNFGNMFSVLGASVLLPFVPMAPIQVLTNNLLYDVSQIPIPTDHVDPEDVARPRPWDIAEIWRFIVFIGPLSSVFDYTTYAILWFVFNARTPAHAALFQTGWFVESLLTQTLIIHVIRTNKIPFLQSRPSGWLVATTLAIMALGVWLPVSPFAAALGFVALPAGFWPLLLLTLAGYLGLTQTVKWWLLRRHWI